MATRRGRARDDLVRAVNNLGMASQHLIRVYDISKEQHPEIAQAIGEILDALLLVSETIQKLRDSF